MKREKEICASFAVASQTAEVTATMCDNCLVKMEKALNLYNKMFWGNKRDHIHITFTTVYCYNCSILLSVIVVNLSLCLLYKLNVIIGMHHSVYIYIYIYIYIYVCVCVCVCVCGLVLSAISGIY